MVGWHGATFEGNFRRQKADRTAVQCSGRHSYAHTQAHTHGKRRFDDNKCQVYLPFVSLVVLNYFSVGFWTAGFDGSIRTRGDRSGLRCFVGGEQFYGLQLEMATGWRPV